MTSLKRKHEQTGSEAKKIDEEEEELIPDIDDAEPDVEDIEDYNSEEEDEDESDEEDEGEQIQFEDQEQEGEGIEDDEREQMKSSKKMVASKEKGAESKEESDKNEVTKEKMETYRLSKFAPDDSSSDEVRRSERFFFYYVQKIGFELKTTSLLFDQKKKNQKEWHDNTKNRVGDIPMEYYDDYDHIGYTLDGKRVQKPPKKDEVDRFLQREDDPDF